MEKIIVKNSTIIINDYSLGDCPKLEYFFSKYDRNTHQRFPKGLYYDEENKRLFLPRGIDVWWVEQLFNTQALVERNKFNKFDRYNNIMMKRLPRDNEQRTALRFMVGKEEYFQTSTKSQLSVNLNTGKGKTYCSIATISYLGIKSMIITYSMPLLKQWNDSILENSNILQKEIYQINGKGSIIMLLNKSPEEISKYKIFLVSHSTLKSYGDHYGWDSITKLFEHLKVGLKFFDEAHQNFDNMLMIDFYTNVYKTYYVTATPIRSDAEENRIYVSSFKNVLSIDLFNPDVDPHTHYVAVRYNSRPAPQIVSMCRNQYGLDRNKYVNYIVTQDAFYRAASVVLDMAFKLAPNPEDKILIYIGTNNAIDIFYFWFIQNFRIFMNDVGIFNSTISAEQKALSLQKKIIISTTKSTGTAIDIRGLKVTIVMAEPFVSQVLARQTLGRTRDRNTYYIELVDKGFFYCNQYFLRKKDIFLKYAESCDLIDLTDIEINTRYNNIIKAKEEGQVTLVSPYTIIE